MNNKNLKHHGRNPSFQTNLIFNISVGNGKRGFRTRVCVRSDTYLKDNRHYILRLIEEGIPIGYYEMRNKLLE